MTQGEIRSAFPTSMLVDPTVQETRSFHSSKSIDGKDRQGTRGFLFKKNEKLNENWIIQVLFKKNLNLSTYKNGSL